MDLLNNLFVKAIVAPLFLAVVAAMFKTAFALVKGKSKGKFKYRLWIKQPEPDESFTIVALDNQSLEAIATRNDVVDVERMVSFDMAEYASLGINLMIAAFALDIVALTNGKSDPAIVGSLVLLHILMLLTIMLLLLLGQLANPEQRRKKRLRALFAISLGIIAMMFAFVVV